jgi:hypothetical protein
VAGQQLSAIMPGGGLRAASRFSRSAAISRRPSRVLSRPPPRAASAGTICASSQPCGSAASGSSVRLAEAEAVSGERRLQERRIRHRDLRCAAHDHEAAA